MGSIREISERQDRSHHCAQYSLCGVDVVIDDEQYTSSGKHIVYCDEPSLDPSFYTITALVYQQRWHWNDHHLDTTFSGKYIRFHSTQK